MGHCIDDDDYNVDGDVDNDVFHLVVAVHGHLGSDLTNNNTGQRLMALWVSELQKTNSSFFEEQDFVKSGPGREKGEPLGLSRD